MIEKRVAETTLQKDKIIEVLGESYKVAPPSTATLILVSEELANAPDIPKTEDSSEVLQWVLANARHCQFLGDVVSILILGAKRIKIPKERVETRLFGLIKKRILVDEKKELAENLLLEYSSKELYELALSLLERLEVGSFFGITTFLIGVNLLKPKKVVTTQSGQQ